MIKPFLALLGGAVAIAAASTAASGAMAQAVYCGPNGCAGTTSGQRVTTYSGPNGTTLGRQASPLTQPPMAFLQDRFPAKG